MYPPQMPLSLLVLALALSLGCRRPVPAPGDTTAAVRPTRTAATDLPRPETGLAPGSPTPVATLDLEQVRLGVPVPNSIKGMAVAYDPQRDELWHAGIFSTWLVAHDPETGVPLRAVDIEVEGFNPARLHVDAERRRLVWVNARKEQVRVVDLDSGRLVHRVDVESRGPSHYPTDANTLDRSDGRVWVWNANNRTLIGYDPAGGESRPLTGIVRALDLSASPGGGKLAVLDAASPDQGRVVVVDTAAGTSAEVCSFSGRPPNHVAMLDDGGLILGEQRVRRVDASCQERWSVELGEAPDSLLVAGGTGAGGTGVGGTVVAPLATGGKQRGGIGAEVALIDLETGVLRARVPSRWEARHATVDEAGGRAWVGNGGDGSATRIPLPDGAGARVLSLASSADDVVVDPTTGDRYVLSRLGGSRIWRWRAGQETAELFAEDCPWPFALELDPTRRLLIAPGYFDGRLYAWPLDGGPARIIDLGIPGSTGDALGELGYDPETGVAAVILPMEGWLSVVDLDAGTVRYTRQFTELAAGPKAGPGRAGVWVGSDSVYVADAVGGRLWRLDAKEDRVLAQGRLPGDEPPGETRPDRAGGTRGPQRGPTGPVGGGGVGGGLAGGGRPPLVDGQRPPRPEGQRPPLVDGQRPPRPEGQTRAGGADRPERGNLYAFGLFFHDRVGGRLFFGSHVLDPSTLEVQQTLPGDLKVFWADAGRVLALAVSAEGQQDDILVLDPATLAEQRRLPALSSPTAHAQAAWDPTTNTAWLADLARARVTGFRVD